MSRALLLLFCATLCNNAFAQRISLYHLMGFHSLDDSAIYTQLQQYGWRYHGIRQDVARKPRMYALDEAGASGAQLYLYQYQKRPLCKVELVCNDVAAFNTTIRDSMKAYGFMPEMDRHVPDEDNLRISSSAIFVNSDAATPVHALILYYEEHRKPKVSLTIYADE